MATAKKSDIVKDRTGFPTGSFLPSDDKALENHLKII